MMPPLTYQIKCIRLFHNRANFVVAGIEGRCAVRCIDEASDNLYVTLPLLSRAAVPRARL
jgi:hypothetical protein